MFLLSLGTILFKEYPGSYQNNLNFIVAVKINSEKDDIIPSMVHKQDLFQKVRDRKRLLFFKDFEEKYTKISDRFGDENL